MAEYESVVENSPGVKLNSLMRRFSLKKRKETAERDATVLNTMPASSDTQTDDGFTWTNWRRSFRQKSKRLKDNFKPLPEQSATGSTVMEKETSGNSDFTYNIMSSPLSVMEINSLIESGALKEAYENVISLQQEVNREQEALGQQAASVNLAHREKDLNLLHNKLTEELGKIVRKSCAQPFFFDKELLLQASGILQDKEKRDAEGLGLLRNVWKTGVQQEVHGALAKIYPNNYEPNVSCVETHLEPLGKKIVELLEMVKADMLNLYPGSFLVFETYASSCHEFVVEHLRVLLGRATKLKDCNDLLDFVTNHYSEAILSSRSLNPEMKEKTFLLPDDLLGQILHETLHASLNVVINAEKNEVWVKKVTPKTTNDETFICSEVYTHVCEMMKRYSDNCATFDENLESVAIGRCMDALKHFLERFKDEFSKQSRSLLGSDLLDCCLWAQYHTIYINSFSSLREHIEIYREKSPGKVKEFVVEVDELIEHLSRALLEQFSVEIQPYLGDLMTKNWLSTDTDFNELVNRMETFSGYMKSMRNPPAQSLVGDMHCRVAKAYISELLKNKYSCKGKKNEEAAAKITAQWAELEKLFGEMGSTLNWLHSLGYDIGAIIKQKHEKDIKNVLKPLVENYPDISKKQLSAILYFRDSSLKFERSSVVQCFAALKRKKPEDAGNHTFFSAME